MLAALRRLWTGSANHSSKSTPSSRRRTTRKLELLEDRNMLTTFTVSNLLDDGVGSLRRAIFNANQTTAADKIIFSPNVKGTIKLTTGHLAVTNDVTIEGPGASVVSVSGNGASRVFSNALNTKLTINDLTVRRGSVADNGGGIINAGELILNRVVVRENTTTGNFDGGGIANFGTDAELTMTRCTVINNTSGRDGGGVWTDDGSITTISLSSITNNVGGANDDGGGIYNEGTTTVSKSTVSQNTGSGASFFGAGIANRNGGVLKVFHSTLHDNISPGRGGGIFSDGASVSMINDTIVNNTSLGSLGGGGVRVTGGDLRINSSTITGNVDASGNGTNAGGVSFTGAGSFIMNNTVVAGNFLADGDAGPPDIRVNLASGFGNFIGIGTADLTGIANGVNGNQIGTTATPIDPKLGPLQNNGGTTLTRMPRGDSPLRNAGVVAALPTGLTIDQRGKPRVVGGSVDIGSTEIQS
jgi:hypothetical protein